MGIVNRTTAKKSVIERPHFMFGKVMHMRLIPKINKFNYSIYYITVPLSKRVHLKIPYNRAGLWSFHDKDHGAKDGTDPEIWVRGILEKYGQTKANGEIVLICMPRILGYVFNPVSFWLCFDKSEKLRSVICEVNNTFGETHSYLCANPDQKEITQDDILRSEKIFHVSPFMPRDGQYTFRFNIEASRFGVSIDYLNDKREKRLITSLSGRYEGMNKNAKLKAFFGYPLITFKTIFLIHWQALKIILKGIKYVPKPSQILPKLSATDGLNKKD